MIKFRRDQFDIKQLNIIFDSYFVNKIIIGIVNLSYIKCHMEYKNKTKA